MGIPIDRILYRYHPVGQGLFASGELWRGHPDWKFVWVYDCGTTSSQAFIDRELDELSCSFWPPSPLGRLRLVTISHFDKDHISGLARLLCRFPVDTLVLPLISLWARLILAFEQKVGADQAVFRFFLDPIGYIRSLPGGERVERIILVPASDGKTPPDPPDEPPDEREPTPEFSEGPLELQIDKIPVDAETAADLMLADGEDVSQVALLAPGGRLTIQDVWEFVPYNDGCIRPDDPNDFARNVAAKTAELRKAANDWRAGRRGSQQETERAVNQLRDCYDQTFGKDARTRNIISLFLYSGPLFHITVFVNPVMGPFSDLPWKQLAQLYSGDGYLDTPERLDALTRYMGSRRMAKVGVFQVMHHGASTNWHKGVAQRIAPAISVFSSDPDHSSLGHPHAEVLRDFWTFGPVQAGRDDGVHIRVIMR